MPNFLKLCKQFTIKCASSVISAYQKESKLNIKSKQSILFPDLPSDVIPSQFSLFFARFSVISFKFLFFSQHSSVQFHSEFQLKQNRDDKWYRNSRRYLGSVSATFSFSPKPIWTSRISLRCFWWLIRLEPFCKIKAFISHQNGRRIFGRWNFELKLGYFILFSSLLNNWKN